MEEFQTLGDEIPQITYARVVHNLPEHPMINVWLLLNVRSDPCIFSSVDEDWLPYTLRDYQNIQQPVTDPYQTGSDIDAFEVKVRNETIDDLKALRQQSFYFYDDITFFEGQPKMHLAFQPDYLLTSEEVYTNVALEENQIR
ncbi:hypothetical protein P879_08253 [Paragonimus westermani]|uniref:Uncharacterized protein n=1 Tax=Paragonimus westermani TaxID=34504 RepID=A0A8T0DQG6_9TREM|nr:hypothetical protein P879_08253 [Paragonimus westermani]